MHTLMTGSNNISCYIHACIVAPPRAGDEANGHPRASVLTQRNSRAKGSVCLNTTCSLDITRQTESREYRNLNRSSQKPHHMLYGSVCFGLAKVCCLVNTSSTLDTSCLRSLDKHLKTPSFALFPSGRTTPWCILSTVAKTQ